MPGIDVADEGARARGIRRVLVLTLALNVAVSAAKVVAGYVAASLSLRADGFHSATDGLNNIVLLVGTWLASRPPDKEHPYGHKKLEVFAAGGIGVALLFVAFDVVKSAAQRLMGAEQAVRVDAVTAVVLFGTLAVNVFVAVYEHRAGKRLHSPALISDAAHTKSDVLVTVGVAVGLGFTWLGYPVFDAVGGIVVSLFIGVTGVRVVRENAAFLMDTSLVDSHDVVDIARGVHGVRGAGEVKSRGVPGAILVEMCIHVDGDMSVARAHEVAHAVEDALKARVEGLAAVQVHVEPA